jgi:hypothetical protein
MNIGDKVTIWEKEYQVYNVLDGLVCFGRTSNGKLLSAKNPNNLMALKTDMIEKYIKVGAMVKH